MNKRTVKKNATKYCEQCVRMVCKLPFSYRLKVIWKLFKGKR